MAQKLLLFWRKPARRCWWEGVELKDVEGVEIDAPLKIWIRRVWTLEMVRVLSRCCSYIWASSDTLTLHGFFSVSERYRIALTAPHVLLRMSTIAIGVPLSPVGSLCQLLVYELWKRRHSLCLQVFYLNCLIDMGSSTLLYNCSSCCFVLKRVEDMQFLALGGCESLAFYCFLFVSVDHKSLITASNKRLICDI